jgi:hypothetical protein
MSFNKYYIPEPVDLAQSILKNGASSVVNRKIDAVIGNGTSVQIFDRAHELFSLGKSDSEILENLTKQFPIYFT